MVQHPWMRIPAIANMLGLILASIGIIIGGIQIKEFVLRKVFLIAGFISLIIFLFLFILFLTLAIRDYIDLYPKFTRSIFWGLIKY